MLLYHFPTSPFARRVRLILSHKGLSAELRDARANPDHAAELRRLNPLHTVPVLVDGERVIADSAAIGHYLDRKQPDPALVPAGLPGAEAFEFVALADSVITPLSDLGMRYAALHDHQGFGAVRETYVGRIQRALDHLAEKVSERREAPALCCGEWSLADIAVSTLVLWLEGLPARAATFPPAKSVVGLGWTLPPVLSEWMLPRKARPDIASLG